MEAVFRDPPAMKQLERLIRSHRTTIKCRWRNSDTPYDYKCLEVPKNPCLATAREIFFSHDLTYTPNELRQLADLILAARRPVRATAKNRLQRAVMPPAQRAARRRNNARNVRVAVPRGDEVPNVVQNVQGVDAPPQGDAQNEPAPAMILHLITFVYDMYTDPYFPN